MKRFLLIAAAAVCLLAGWCAFLWFGQTVVPLPEELETAFTEAAGQYVAEQSLSNTAWGVPVQETYHTFWGAKWTEVTALLASYTVNDLFRANSDEWCIALRVVRWRLEDGALRLCAVSEPAACRGTVEHGGNTLCWRPPVQSSGQKLTLDCKLEPSDGWSLLIIHAGTLNSERPRETSAQFSASLTCDSSAGFLRQRTPLALSFTAEYRENG